MSWLPEQIEVVQLRETRLVGMVMKSKSTAFGLRTHEHRRNPSGMGLVLLDPSEENRIKSFCGP